MRRTGTRAGGSRGRTAGGLLLLGLGYYTGARLGFALTFRPHPVSTLWVPNAILMASFLVSPVRIWGLILLAAFPAHLASELGAGVPAPMILSWFLSNSAEALIGAGSVLLFSGRPIRLDRLQTLWLFVALAVLLAPFLSSFLDAALVGLNDWGEASYGVVWRNRFFSNSLAAVTVVPVILSFAARARTGFARTGAARYAEAALLLIAVLAVSYLVFGRLRPGPEATAALLYTPLPILLWAAVRFGPTGASTCTLIVVIVAIWNSVHGRGPFATASPGANALSLQLLFLATCITLLILAAVVAERQQALHVARRSEDHLQRVLSERQAAEALTAAENQILEMIATAAPLEDILKRLVALVESEAPGIVGSVLLLEGDGVHARHRAGSHLPDEYVSAIDGLAIGPNVGSCGTAMYLQRTVISTDIPEDPLWADYRELAAAHGFRACWSKPILSTRWKVLGSFAMYYREPRGPTASEARLVDLATQLAAIAVERDIAEMEAKEQEREVERLGRVAVLGGLSGALAHELSQPLAAILANAQAAQRLLERSTPNIGEVREILADIVFANQRVGMVIGHLRGMLSKRGSERVPLHMAAVVDDALQLVSRDLADRHVRVTVRMDPSLPPVLGDRVQLEQVLLNLIRNACEAMSASPAERRELRIAATSLNQTSVRISVTDSGPGIPRDLAERICEPFVTSKPDGLGLGLSISRSILNAHGGKLLPESDPAGGATFRVVLPAAGEPAGSLAGRSPEQVGRS